MVLSAERKSVFNTLISTTELSNHLNDPNWVIFDCRFTLTDVEAGHRAYQIDHIPGAQYVHLDNDLSSPITAKSGRHPLPDPEELSHKLGQWGVDATKQVIVYDDSFGSIAARMWWLLHWLGHEAVALLDGGFSKWRREGLPLTAELPKVTPAQFKQKRDDSLWVDSEFVAKEIAEGKILLIDARAEERFLGDIEPLDKVAGHVPGAINIPYEDNLDFGGDFLPEDELRQFYQENLRHKSPENVVLMCGSGVTACHTILAMEQVGLHGVKLYAGSWSEWITDNKRPVAKGE